MELYHIAKNTHTHTHKILSHGTIFTWLRQSVSTRGSWEADIAVELTGLGDPSRPRDRKIDDCSDRRDQSNVPALPARLKLAAGTGWWGERREDFILTASHAGVTGSGTEDQDEGGHLKTTTNSRR